MGWQSDSGNGAGSPGRDYEDAEVQEQMPKDANMNLEEAKAQGQPMNSLAFSTSLNINTRLSIVAWGPTWPWKRMIS